MGKVKLHMRMGWLLAGVAVLVVIFAWPVMMGFAPRMLSLGFIDLEKPETLIPQAWMWYNDLMALLAFSIMVGIAIWKRKIVALHRSMVLFASMMFLAPAVARLLEWMASGIATFMAFILTSLGIMFALPIAVVIHDWIRYKKFPLYPAVGLGIMVLTMILNFIIPNTEWGMALFMQHIK